MLDRLTMCQTPSLTTLNFTAPCLVQSLEASSTSSIVQLIESLCDVHNNLARLNDSLKSAAISGIVLLFVLHDFSSAIDSKASRFFGGTI